MRRMKRRNIRQRVIKKMKREREKEGGMVLPCMSEKEKEREKWNGLTLQE